MTYTYSKPDSGPSPKLDAPTIRGNFSSFGSTFSNTSGGVVYNHVPLNSRNQGDHAAVILEIQSQFPIVDQDLVALYATSNSIYFNIPQFLPTDLDPTPAHNSAMLLAYNTINTSGPVYQSFLCGNYLIFMGQTTNINVAVTVSPSPVSWAMILAQPSSGIPTTTKFSTTAISSNQFIITASPAPSGAYSFSFIAIGKIF